MDHSKLWYGMRKILGDLRIQLCLTASLPSILWLLVFWPGILVSDSFIQWDQMIGTRPLNDWHPAFHTLLMRQLTNIYFSPISVALAQIMALGIAVDLALMKFWRLGLPRIWVVTIALFFFLNPFVGQFSITLIKDSFYTIGVVALSSWGLFFFCSDLPKAKPLKYLILLGFILTLLGTALVRHNGAPAVYLFLIMFVFFIPKKSRLPVTVAALIFLAASFCIKDIYYPQIMKPIDRAERTKLKGLSFMPQISVQLQSGYAFSEDENETIDQIMPNRSLWYMPNLAGQSTELWVRAGKGCDLFYNEEFTAKIMLLSIKAFLKNPMPVLKFTFWNNEKLWNPLRTNSKFIIYWHNNKVLTNYDDPEAKTTIDHPTLVRNSQIPDLVEPIANFYWWFSGNADQPNIFDRVIQTVSSVAFHFYAFFILGIVSYYQSRKKVLLVPMLLVISNLVFLIPLINADLVNYYLFIPFLSIIWSPIYVYNILSHSTNRYRRLDF